MATRMASIGTNPARTVDTEVDSEIIAEAIPHLPRLAALDGSTSNLNRRGTEYTGLPAETHR